MGVRELADVTGSITIGGPPVTVTTTILGQNARLSFDGTAGQRVSLGMTGVTIGTRCYYGVYGSILAPDGTTLASVQVGGGGGGLDTAPLPTTGTYTVLVDAGILTGSLTLSVMNP